jgi:alkylation response protein AidB-like acyl-CoA dehydrogenase
VDFTFDEQQLAVLELAEQILADRATPDRLNALDASGDGFDDKLWADLAEAGLVGVALPEDHGGGGAGFAELCVAIEAAAEHAAHAPLYEAILLGALPVARFGTAEQRARLLPGVVTGETLLSAALAEPGGNTPYAPATTAVPCEDGSWRLHGVKTLVPLADRARRVLVPAADEHGRTGVFLVDPGAHGVRAGRQDTLTRRPVYELELDGACVTADDVLRPPGDGGELLDWLLPRATAGLCVQQVGVCTEALRLTAGHTTSREQFGRPIGTFQAVTQRIADAYIDTEAIRLTAWQAIWLLDQDVPADEEVAIAAWWAAEAAPRVLDATQHLHGGIGADLDYPLHRYFLLGRWNELALGGPARHLHRLGTLMAGTATPQP